MENANKKWESMISETDAKIVKSNRFTILKTGAIVILRLCAASCVFLIAYSMFDLQFPALKFLDERALGLVVILLFAGVIDLAIGIVPIEITYPLMVAGVVRAIVLGDASFLLYWFALALIYLLNVVGGGDLKLLMGMFGLWPHLEFFIALEAVIIATHLPLIIYRRTRKKNWRAQFQFMYRWTHLKLIEIIAGETTPHKILHQAIVRRPTSETLSHQGDRLAIAFSFAGILYLFVCTPVGMNWRFAI